MSFDKLVDANVVKKSKEVVIKHKDGDLVFTANEISYAQRLQLAIIQNSGGDSFSQLVVFSIKDKDGNHMKLEQAQSLPEEYFQPLFVAASEVNAQGSEKN